MFIKVRGKGNRERVIPMSIVLRKHLYPYSKTHYFDLFFPSRSGQPLNYDNCLEDLKTICFKLKISCKAFHGFRRAFARGFVKNGGDIFSLQMILGHTDINTTRIYVDLNPEDLKEIHLKNSILSRLR
jgi:site-specific recombinase XerD